MSFLVFRVPLFQLLFLRTLNRHQPCHVRYVVLFIFALLVFLLRFPTEIQVGVLKVKPPSFSCLFFPFFFLV